MRSIDNVEEQMRIIHGDDLVIVRETYRGVAKKATFIDCKYGLWEAYVSNVLAGHAHPMRGRERIKLTCLERYGSTSPLGNDAIRERAKATLVTNYGVDNAMKSSITQEKMRQTLIDRYGVDNVAKLPTVREKSQRTCLEHYGAEYPLRSQICLAKSKTTCLERYGAENPMQVEQFKSAMRHTCLERYGVENPMQNAEIYDKSLRSKRRVVELNHWKINQPLMCVGSYEVATVNWLNEREIDYDWQVKICIPRDESVPTEIRGKTYVIDALVKFSDELYVEIKGRWMQQISKTKWEWFHSTHANSELWTRDVLRSRGIL